MVHVFSQDIGPRYAGVLLGMSNTAGVLAGVFGTAATGYILKHGTWDDVWGVAVALYLVGALVWNLFSTGETLPRTSNARSVDVASMGACTQKLPA